MAEDNKWDNQEDWKQHQLRALHLQVQAALWQIRDNLQWWDHDRDRHQSEAGFVDFWDALNDAHKHLEEAQRLIQQHDKWQGGNWKKADDDWKS